MSNQDFARVPGRENYSLTYLRCGRIYSYAHQIDTIISFEAKSVLEVGAGGGVVTAALLAAGLKVTTLDVQSELCPDILGSVTQIPCGDGAFDLALCSQVLEHLPFDQFVPALQELGRVTRQGLVLSLPDVSRHWYIAGKLPKMPQFNVTLHLARRTSMPESRLEHYWEIGFKGYHLKRVSGAILSSGWRISRTWRVPEMPWHRFFRLEKT